MDTTRTDTVTLAARALTTVRWQVRVASHRVSGCFGRFVSMGSGACRSVWPGLPLRLSVVPLVDDDAAIIDAAYGGPGQGGDRL